MRPIALLLCLAATTALVAPALADMTGPDILSGPAASAKLELRGVAVRADGAVSGTVYNGSGVSIRDVELLVSHVWAWSNERHPGENNPGRSSRVEVSGEIPAMGSVTFSYVPEPPLPARADGRFQTTAAVQSFTEIEN